MTTDISNSPPTPPSVAGMHDRRPGAGFWLLMLFSLVAVGSVAYLQYSRVDTARVRNASREQLNAKPEPLPIIATLPDFTLMESVGKRVSLDQLRGRVWVADFFFTYCAGPCPVMSRRMKELRQLLKEQKMEDVICVSISVDPARDTPKVLQEYGRMMQAEPDKWLFLTGQKSQIYDLAVKGFKIAVADESQADEQILHSTRFVLVDRQGRIRGYYKALDDDEEIDPQLAVPGRGLPHDIKQRLLTDIRFLRDEGVK